MLLLVDGLGVRVTTRGTDTERSLPDASLFRPPMVRGRDDSNLGEVMSVVFVREIVTTTTTTTIHHHQA